MAEPDYQVLIRDDVGTQVYYRDTPVFTTEDNGDEWVIRIPKPRAQPDPGPWALRVFGDLKKIWSSDGVLVADITGCSEANALLIREAPELLRIVEAYLENRSGSPMNWGHMSVADAELARECVARIKSVV